MTSPTHNALPSRRRRAAAPVTRVQAAADELPPMLRQYHALKARHPGTLLLFRLGDFYELFYEDAELAARELEITLTSRGVGKGQRIPMCGVPYHAATGYVARLVERGFRLAICDQIEDPRRARGLVRREVTRIITPGTVMEEALLPPRAGAYAVALAREEPRWGLAAADLSTGEFIVTDGPAAERARLLEELARLEPREVLVPPADLAAWPEVAARYHVTTLDDWRWEAARARRALTEHFHVATLDGYGLGDHTPAVAAAGALLQYLQETQKSPLHHLRGVRTYALHDHLVVDEGTRRNLEVLRNPRDGTTRHTLLGVLDWTVTAMGGRLLRAWLSLPLRGRGAIASRLDAVEELVHRADLREGVRAALRPIADLARLVGRIGHGSATPRDLVALRRSLERLPDLRRTLVEAHSDLLGALAVAVQTHDDVAGLIARALVDDPPTGARELGVIREGYDADLDALRQAAHDGRGWIARLEAAERDRTGIRSLRVGFNKVFGYYIEVSKPNLRLVPGDYIRKQTLTNAERFITGEMKEREAQILGAEERIAEREAALFAQVRQAVAIGADGILRTADALAQWDALAALAEVAARRGWVRPELVDDPILRVRAGRHPVVEEALPAGSFVPNDVDLDPDRAVLIVTGPNMAGKSVYCRQAAVIVILAQMGAFVPAAGATVGLVDRVFARVGATDDMAMGRSTFLVEMQETAAILHTATRQSLIILDEVGRGTSTYDGMSLAWAVVEHVHDQIGARTLFATHFHELTDLATLLPRVHNVNVLVQEQGDEVVFLHRVADGAADRSYGIHVARLAGIPASVIGQAGRVLAHLEAASAGPALGEAFLGPLPGRARGALQIPLPLDVPSAVEEELLELAVETMSPLEALNTLSELRERVRALRGQATARARDRPVQ